MTRWKDTVARAVARAGNRSALARKLGISRSQIIRWGSDRHLPRWPNVVAVADAAGLDAEERVSLHQEITATLLSDHGYPETITG